MWAQSVQIVFRIRIKGRGGGSSLIFLLSLISGFIKYDYKILYYLGPKLKKKTAALTDIGESGAINWLTLQVDKGRLEEDMNESQFLVYMILWL